MERITAIITANTHDMGEKVLRHLDEWISRMDVTVTVEMSVETLPPPDPYGEEAFAARLREEGR